MKKMANVADQGHSNDFFSVTPEQEKSPKFNRKEKFDDSKKEEMRNKIDIDENKSKSYSVFRKARKIMPRDNIGLDFFSKQ